MRVALDSLYHLRVDDDVYVPVRIRIQREHLATFAASDGHRMRHVLRAVAARLQLISERAPPEITTVTAKSQALPILIKCDAASMTACLAPTPGSYRLAADKGSRHLTLCRETIVIDAIPPGFPISSLPPCERTRLITEVFARAGKAEDSEEL
ncbi:unnamed protein product (mitochondrion) [Plasmodiophora brassicae]|uniref:Uncharacterized protein n=1 Tax=Plasmodiophora brassicae TaxID=37360 RepID=A0A0G4IV85_PLABS|nr:hypothetical protein PBRA_007188 [Plasmodiophora brassicae]SPQ98626.1 unnamed protein product [Plasmodiophora brassicae]